jgi:hypothetical protein
MVMGAKKMKFKFINGFSSLPCNTQTSIAAINPSLIGWLREL